jgi:ParB family transcriptional regulator, chromosome partitioning protein
MREEVPFSALVPTAKQARQQYTRLDELADSIFTHGLLHNLVCRRKSDGTIELVAGERRRRAIAILMLEPEDQVKQYGRFIGGWEAAALKSGSAHGGIPVFMLPSSADETAHLIENIQREELWPWEYGRYLAAWYEAGYTQEWIAERICKQQTEVSKFLRLGTMLSPKVTEAIEKTGDRHLLGKKQLLKISKLYDDVLKEPLHTRQVEEFEKLLGKVQVYKTPDESRSERIRVHDRALKLGRMKLPGHAKPYVREIYEYLFGPDYKRPNFNWK